MQTIGRLLHFLCLQLETGQCSPTSRQYSDWLPEVQLYSTKLPCSLHSPPSMAFISKPLCFQVNIMGLNVIFCQALTDPRCGINVNTASLILSTVLGEKWQAISHPFCSGGKNGKVNCSLCICAQPSGHFHLDILLACQTQLTPN